MTQRAVVLAGDPEYGSEVSMRPIADLLAREAGIEVDYRTPSVIADEPDFAESSFGGLEELADADLLIIYTRFRRLPDPEMEAISQFLDRGGAVLGLRTASHAFHFAPEERWHAWNRWFGAHVLGSPWISHHGHSSSTDVTVVPDSPPALVAGLPDRFTVRSWLYRTELEPWCRVILSGTPIAPESAATPGPVAWYGHSDNRRTFYTSLGHAEDLVLEPVQRLLANAGRWLLADEPT